jgi:hypothetical protein
MPNYNTTSLAGKLGLCKRTGCVYLCPVLGSCDYRLYTGKGRGCGVGDACTVYETGDRRKIAMKHSKKYNEILFKESQC